MKDFQRISLVRVNCFHRLTKQSWLFIGDIPRSKSFKNDILRGYLFFYPNQFMDLRGKRIFRGIYPCLLLRRIA